MKAPKVALSPKISTAGIHRDYYVESRRLEEEG
jgi:hypothetical protein